MRILSGHIKALLICISFFHFQSSFGQGRVVINEYMPWTLNGCGATSEFVELMNFGPGPMDIGCYILTDGDYSVTIPPNTILQPGEFYVIAGQDTINSPCANIDSTIHADLNWNTCNCTSDSIPTTGDGFFTDGGSANEQVVLLDPNLNVVDAVIRDLPAEPSSMITTMPMGTCGGRRFDLDLMSINYETLGMSAGRGNSFARKLDGDCGWVKDPQQSGNATNNTSGVTSDVSYTLSIVKSMDCDSTHGSIDIYVDVGSYTNDVFPMNYTIAFDADSNGLFDFSDTYTYGVDSTSPSIAITGLPLGRYKITVGSVKGCFLKTFDVAILQCTDVLPVKLVYFKLLNQNRSAKTFEWLMGETSDIVSVQLQKSKDGFAFSKAAALDNLNFTGSRLFVQSIPAEDLFMYYRLQIISGNGSISYSPVIVIPEKTLCLVKAGPNPAKEKLYIQLVSNKANSFPYVIYNIKGYKLQEGRFAVKQGSNQIDIPVSSLPSGIYQLQVAELITYRFVK